MSWKKHFKLANTSGQMSPLGGASSSSAPQYRHYQSQLPELYSGHPNRIDRYNQIENMDASTEVNTALDIIAEFSTQKHPITGMVFDIDFNEPPSDSEAKIIKEQLRQWVNLNELNKRMFKMFRSTIKYGDQVFIRDPENFKLLWTEISKVTKVIVNEANGKEPEQYVIKDLNPNLMNLSMTGINSSDTFVTHPQVGGPSGAYIQPRSPYSGGSRFSHTQEETPVSAEHVVHLSLTEGLDPYWPFGTSILENVFKVYKQKELLEDAVIIYRIQRAPERRVFKIDVGDMPPHLAMSYVERIKNEIHQRRIPSNTGGGANMVDSTYSPLATLEDFFFPIGADGRGSDVTVLPPGCLDMNTRVPLLDGRTLNLYQMAEEHKNGKQNWVYSCNPDTGEIVPGIVSWAGVTNESAKVMKITLDNNEEIVCTPDHKFPVIGKGFVEAKDLVIDESMIPFNKKNDFLGEYRKYDYTKVYQNDTKKWIPVHKMVTKYLMESGIISSRTFDERFVDSPKDTVHHADFDRFNNEPTNLIMMSYKDHAKYHNSVGFSEEAQRMGTAAAKAKLEELKKDPSTWAEYIEKCSAVSKKVWENKSEEERNDHINLLVQGSKKYVSELSESEYQQWYMRLVDLCKNNSLKGNETLQELLENNSEFRADFTNKQKQGWAKFKNTDASRVRSEKISKHLKEYMSLPEVKEKYALRQTVRMDRTVISMIQKIASNMADNITIESVVDEFNKTEEYLDYYLQLNTDVCAANWDKSGMTVSQLKSGLTRNGYSGWTQFKNEFSMFNHKVISIEFLDSPIEVGTLTIDADEKYHNFHTFALESGIFTKNSNVGEISDLRWFTNKLFRGLRIPPSYLPTGDEDSDRSFNDGKVGTALIQEWQFNQYCKRLQSLMIDKFDTEFKIFMRWRGINIDGQIFKLVFNEPQNFAQYRQADVDSQRISTFTQMEGFGYMSKRFMMKRYLGLSESEIEENNSLWQEENADYEDSAPDNASLRSVGITPGSIESDMGSIEGIEGGEEEGMAPPNPANTVEAPPAPPTPLSGGGEGGM